MYKKRKNVSTNWTNQYKELQDKLRNGPVKIIKPASDNIGGRLKHPLLNKNT